MSTLDASGCIDVMLECVCMLHVVWGKCFILVIVLVFMLKGICTVQKMPAASLSLYSF